MGGNQSKQSKNSRAYKSSNATDSLNVQPIKELTEEELNKMEKETNDKAKT